MSLIVPSKKYFVYTLSFDEYAETIFYIGKGKGNRPQEHVIEARTNHLCPKCAILRYLARMDLGCWTHTVIETDDESYAYWYEMKTITSFPYGALCNQVAGERPPYRVKVAQDSKGWGATLYRYEDNAVHSMGSTRYFNTERDAEIGLVQFYDEWTLDHYLPKFGIDPTVKKVKKRRTSHKPPTDENFLQDFV